MRIGSCELDDLVKLLVDGSSDADKIGIIKEEKCETSPCNSTNDCDFADFIIDFESGWLKMYGKGECDEIWGSQFDDTYLEGEFVVGHEGVDYIHLDNDVLTCVSGHPTGHGNEGSDWIYGTTNGDYVWADTYSVSAGAGSDTVYTYEGSDEIDLGYGNSDRAYGGSRNDQLWGGPGNFDRVYGQEDDDWLWGGTGVLDYCRGGSGYDHCNADCETRIECEAW